MGLDHSSFPENDLSASLDLELAGHGLNGCSHVVNDNTFLLRSVVNETGRPTFKGLETEREAVLAWGETATIVNHGLLPGEHVSRLEVAHLIVAVG